MILHDYSLSSSLAYIPRVRMCVWLQFGAAELGAGFVYACFRVNLPRFFCLFVVFFLFMLSFFIFVFFSDSSFPSVFSQLFIQLFSSFFRLAFWFTYIIFSSSSSSCSILSPYFLFPRIFSIFIPDIITDRFDKENINIQFKQRYNPTRK